MVELSAEMAELWGSLGAPAPGRTLAVEFIAARAGEGVSTVAREFALHAAQALGRRVWLVDLDLMAQSQAASLASQPARFGALGPPAAATPDGSMFFSVQPPLKRPDGRPWPDARYISAHQLGVLNLWVTLFRREALRGRQGVHVMPRADYWRALRRHTDLIVVDAPAAERSQAGLSMARFMDAVVLVIAADEGDARAPGDLRDALTAAGGHCAGLFFNRTQVQRPRFLGGAAP
ncbi:MAG TPA: sugar kinase [Caulobacteraceae bacterium]|nr:sugar kinase [Caulobacteraceae bacterium]